MNEVRRLAEECAALLDEARALIDRVPEEDYARTAYESAGSVGSQLRHCLDCITCFVEGTQTGRVDYDRRGRDTHTEVDRRHGADCLAKAAQLLREDVAGWVDRDLSVRMDEPDRAANQGWQRSSTARELRFLATHTLHHFALISLMLAERGFEMDPAFGLAPATADFRARSKARRSG